MWATCALGRAGLHCMQLGLALHLLSRCSQALPLVAHLLALLVESQVCASRR